MFSNISTYLLQNDPWVQRKLHQCGGKLSVRWASTGVDRRRGLPNNRLRDPAGIPDFHPQIHLNNDAGKLSRVMVATRKYKEIYDMQASRRKATWFNMQKLVVNNYALGILVLRSQHLKVLTSIASRSHTVTDPQPNKIHCDQPTKPTKPISGSN
jgi:hypothetical protein